MNIRGNRTDLYLEKIKIKEKYNDIYVNKKEDNNYVYHTIYFPTNYNKRLLVNTIKNEIITFINDCSLHENFHILIVGLGNESHTADSVGPKVLKYLDINSHYEILGLNEKVKLSAIEPGVLSQTGILTNRIVESIVTEIKPDLIILIDAYVTEDIDNLNHTIEITNEGIVPGSGIIGINSKINKDTTNIPTIVIGIPTAIEIELNSNKKDNSFKYLLSTNNIDSFVYNISKIIAYSINEVVIFYNSN